MGARALSAHLRKLCDYLVFEVTNSGVNLHINKCVDTINDMIWKYNVVTIDRLVLCLALRTHEGNEAQVCFFIIQLLLLKTHEFRNRVQEFVKENSPDYWKVKDKFLFEVIFIKNIFSLFFSKLIGKTHLTLHFNIFLVFINLFLGMRNISPFIRNIAKNSHQTNQLVILQHFQCISEMFACDLSLFLIL